MTEKHNHFYWLVALSGFALPASAFAYIDPGTGSMVLQGALAALAGVAVTAKLYWGRIRSFFYRRRKVASDLDSPEATKGVGEDQ